MTFTKKSRKDRGAFFFAAFRVNPHARSPGTTINKSREDIAYIAQYSNLLFVNCCAMV